MRALTSKNNYFIELESSLPWRHHFNYFEVCVIVIFMKSNGGHENSH